MSRGEEVQYEQDRLGNEKKKLDEIRAREGNAGGFGGNDGIVEIQGTAETGNAQLLYSNPTHADRVHPKRFYAHNSAPSGNNNFHFVEGELDGSGGLSNTTRRSVDINVDSQTTRIDPYMGQAFERSVGVVADFEGQVAIDLISDHDEASEPDTEDTSTPS